MRPMDVFLSRAKADLDQPKNDTNKQMMRDAHARAINQPTLELIADILEKHTNGVLAGAREHIERRKSRRKDDEALLRQALEALDSCDAAHPSDGGQQWYDNKAVDAAITALRERLGENT